MCGAIASWKSRLHRKSLFAATCFVLFPILVHSQPVAFTLRPGPVRATNATLQGVAVPQGSPTTAWFEWGRDSHYGSSTSSVDIGAGYKVVAVSATLEGLLEGDVIHYRLVASNAVGMVYGIGQALTTGTRFATWSDDYLGFFPSPPSGISNLVAVAKGHAFSLGLRNDGTVLAWRGGIDFYDYGQTNVPAGLSDVIAVAGGWTHSLALRRDGTVSAWGQYSGTTRPVAPPSSLSNVVAIAGGDSHSLALKSDGTVVAWGDNTDGQTSVPFRLTNVVAIAAGSTYSVALKADGKVVSWGSSFSGSIAPPSWLSNVVTVASETWHTLALLGDGTVVAWGANDFGQTNVPIGLSNVVALAAGFQHSLALKSDGTLVAWGNSSYVHNVPAGLSNVVAIASGDYNSLALTPQNLPPRTFAKSATFLTNVDSIIPLVGWDPNGDSLTFRVAFLPTNGALYQFTGTGRGPLLTAPGIVVDDPLHRLIFAPSLNGSGAPYATFSIDVSDGVFDSSPAVVTVNVVSPPLIEPAGYSRGTNAGFAFGFTGFSNLSYIVKATTDFRIWNTLGVASQVTPGQFFYLDSGATNASARVYRLLAR